MVKKNAHIFAAFCLICIIFLLWFVSLDRSQFYPYKMPHHKFSDTSHAIDIKTTHELIKLFNKNKYETSLEKGEIPKIFLNSIPPDFKTIKDNKQKKSLFIRLMLPIIQEENKRLRQQRIIAQLLLNNINQLTQPEVVNWFIRAKKEYKVGSSNTFQSQRKELLKRLDELPLTLILAQAAVESAWGTSRFAIEGNSLFGQWTFSGKDGLTPKNRSEGKSHQVKAFPTLQASIRSYLKNINRNNAYKELRDYRETMRIKNKKLDAFKLAEGLHRYSQKGYTYVEIIHGLLNSEDFQSLKTYD